MFPPTKELIHGNPESSAQASVEWGIATLTAVQGPALDTAIKQAQAMAEGPTMAYAAAKELLETTLANNFVAQTDIETQEIAANMAGHDGKEGIDAFVNKRKPNFKGVR